MAPYKFAHVPKYSVIMTQLHNVKGGNLYYLPRFVILYLNNFIFEAESSYVLSGDNRAEVAPTPIVRIFLFLVRMFFKTLLFHGIQIVAEVLLSLDI